MYPTLRKGDLFEGNYKFCTANCSTKEFTCYDYFLKWTVLDVVPSFNDSRRFQNIFIEIRISPNIKFCAVGNYDRCSGTGSVQEAPGPEINDSNIGISNFSISKNGTEILINYTEITLNSYDTYVAKLYKNEKKLN